MLITADHGNIELMMDEKNNQLHTQHTTNLVPFVYMGKKSSITKKNWVPVRYSSNNTLYYGRKTAKRNDRKNSNKI